jgi:DNA mismatch repair ATPase MutS
LKNAQSEKLKKISQALSALSDPTSQLSAVSRGFRGLAHPAFAALPDFVWFHSGWSLRRLRHAISDNEAELAAVFGAVGELDAFVTFSELASKSGYIFPTVVEGESTILNVNEGHHPALFAAAPDKSVPNSVSIFSNSPENGSRNFVVVTGPNMSGKSTFMRTVAVLPIQAQTGAPVPAIAMEFTPVNVTTSMRITDSLAQGKSFFDAETDRMKEIIDRSKEPERLLVVFDEILLGTNPREREAAEREIIKYLSNSGQLFLLATHNLHVTTLADENGRIQNWHFSMDAKEGRSEYSFRIAPGPATTSNAITVLEQKGYPVEITSGARRALGP